MGRTRWHRPGKTSIIFYRSSIQPLPQDRRVAEPAIRKQRIVRNKAGLRPARTQIEAMAVFTRHGIEHQKPAAAPAGLFLRLRHQGGADAVAAKRAMHQELLDIGPMRLVGRRITVPTILPSSRAASSTVSPAATE